MLLSPPNSSDCSTANARMFESSGRPLFSRLPDEIAEQVFLADIFSRKDLCELALVSRRFSRLIQASLYHDAGVQLLEEQSKRLTRTLVEHPELASHVWRVSLSNYSLRLRRWHNDQERLFTQAQQLLKLLPALRSLGIANFKCSDGLTSLFDNPMSHVREISFLTTERSRAIQEVTRAVSFPQIQRLWIKVGGQLLKEDGADEWKRRRTALNALAGTSSLKELTMWWYPEWLILNTDLLKIPRSLEMLKCEFCDEDSSPERFFKALRPLYSTLVTLDFSYNGASPELYATRPVADFSCFVRLKTIIIDDFYCLESWSSDSRPHERCGFHNRLPFTLERLLLRFRNVDQRGGFTLETQLSNCHDRWVLEIAEHKSTKFPMLKEVTFQEEREEDEIWVESEWEYPQDLLMSFKTSRIDLFIGNKRPLH